MIASSAAPSSTTIVVFLFVIATPFMTDAFARLGYDLGVVPIAAGDALLAAGWLVRQDRMGWAFVLTCLSIALSVITVGGQPIAALDRDAWRAQIA